MNTEKRLIYSDGRLVPRSGDIARVLENVKLDSGSSLRKNQNVLVEHVLEEAPEFVGVKWRDEEGTHVMALRVSVLEIF